MPYTPSYCRVLVFGKSTNIALTLFLQLDSLQAHAYVCRQAAGVLVFSPKRLERTNNRTNQQTSDRLFPPRCTAHCTLHTARRRRRKTPTKKTPTTYAYDLRLRPTPTTYAFRPHNSSTLTIELGNLNTETQEHNTHTQQYKETSGSHINLLYFPLLTTSITAATDLFSTLLPITTPLTPLFLLSSSSSSQSLAHLTLSCPLPLPQPATKDSDLPCHLDPHFSRIRPFL